MRTGPDPNRLQGRACGHGSRTTDDLGPQDVKGVAVRCAGGQQDNNYQSSGKHTLNVGFCTRSCPGLLTEGEKLSMTVTDIGRQKVVFNHFAVLLLHARKDRHPATEQGARSAYL